MMIISFIYAKVGAVTRYYFFIVHTFGHQNGTLLHFKIYRYPSQLSIINFTT